MPTDTIYGLVCSAADKAAVWRLYALKNREQKPGTVIAANVDQLVALGVKKRYLTAVEQFWPNAISVIVPCPELDYLHQGLFSLPMRIPEDQHLRTMLEKAGPLLTSSANRPGELPAANFREAQAYFGDTVDFYVDGGDLSNRLPSTLIRIVDDAIEVLRPGAVTINEETGRIA